MKRSHTSQTERRRVQHKTTPTRTQEDTATTVPPQQRVQYPTTHELGECSISSEDWSSESSVDDDDDASIERECLDNDDENEQREAFLARVNEDPFALEGSDYVNDKEVVLTAVNNLGRALFHASEALQGDKEVVLAAVNDCGFSLGCSSKALQGDKEIVLAAVSKDGYALEYASKALQNDNEVVLAAICHGYPLRCTSVTLKGDKEIVLAAVNRDGGTLKYASWALQADNEVVLAAVRNYGGALEYASEALRADKEVVLAAVRNYGGALEYASEALRADKEVVLAAVKNYGKALKHASNALQADREVVLAAVRNYGGALEYASETLRADKEVVLVAVNNCGKALQFVSGELLDCSTSGDLTFVETVIRSLSSFHGTSDFSGLKDALSSLYSKLQLICHQGNLELEDFSSILPNTFAAQWQARPRETQWCLDQACENGLLATDTQQHISEFTGLAGQFHTAGLLHTYSPIICAMLEKTQTVSNMWELLEYYSND